MAKPRHVGPQETSQRMLRVAEVVRHVVAGVLSRGSFNDPVLDGHVITVPEVRMSPDLKLATIYVMPLLGRDMKQVLAALERHKKPLRSAVATEANLRFAPDIRFLADESFDKGARIDALLASPMVKRDLAVLGDDDPQEPSGPT